MAEVERKKSSFVILIATFPEEKMKKIINQKLVDFIPPIWKVWYHLEDTKSLFFGTFFSILVFPVIIGIGWDLPALHQAIIY